MDTPLIHVGVVPLGAICRRVSTELLDTQVDALNAAAAKAEIYTVDRWSMWIAQLAVESSGFTRFEENLNYSAAGLLATWPHRFDAASATELAHHPDRIANRVYANRLGNGDEASGDGYRFRGRGAIQLTGRANYAACGAAMDLDLLAHPELAAGDARFLIATWFWATRQLNALADDRDVEAVTRAVNGGLTGLAERQAFFNDAQDTLPLFAAAEARRNSEAR